MYVINQLLVAGAKEGSLCIFDTESCIIAVYISSLLVKFDEPFSNLCFSRNRQWTSGVPKIGITDAW